MSLYKYWVVDVFTRTALEGNPLAVFLESDGLDDGTMQRIARELNLSETVFLEPATREDCVRSFRIFTPTREMPFAGHPTIGASYVLLRQGWVDAKADRFAVEEKVGPVGITVEHGEAPMIWLETPPICLISTFDLEGCAAALRLRAEDLLGIQPELLSAGNPTILVAARDREAVDRACVDNAQFEKLMDGGSSALCLMVFAPTEHGAYSRVFAPEYGIIEDPATGSSTGPLGAFMKQHGLLPVDRTRFYSEQGTKMGRRSLLYFEFHDSGQGERVMVGGYVTPLVEAAMTL